MWLSVRLTTAADQAEALSEALMEHGALSVDIEDADAGTDAEKPQFGEPQHYPERLWDRSTLNVLFDADSDLASVLATAAGHAGLAAVPEFTIQEIEEKNWVQLTQAQFEPIRITDGLWIVPSWHAAPNPSAINIEMDPGMAFGTGTHPTTHLCLEWLTQQALSGASVLDYGCGSGILAIAAAKLGAMTIVGIDIEAPALAASQANAERNQTQIAWHHASDPLNEQYDFIVANILTKPLCILAPTLSARLAPGGKIALSGVLATQAEELIAAYAPFLALTVADEREGWIRLEGFRSC